MYIDKDREDRIIEKFEESVSNNLYLHIKEMRKKTKWYIKPLYVIKGFKATLFHMGIYGLFAYLIVSSSPIWIPVGLGIVFLVVTLATLMVIEDKENSEAAFKYLKNLVFTNLADKYHKYLDECLKTGLSLTSIKSLSKDITMEEFQYYLEAKNGEITYYNVFPDYVSSLQKEIKQNIKYEKNKHTIKEKKEKGNELLKMVYEEMEHK